MTDNPWQNDAERRRRESKERQGEGSSPEPRPAPPAPPKTGQARLSAAFTDAGQLSPTRRLRLAEKAEALDHPRNAELVALAARVEADPSLWHRLGASTRLQLGMLAESVRARAELDDNGPEAA